jgi:iron complex outermembrane receptor protein
LETAIRYGLSSSGVERVVQLPEPLKMVVAGPAIWAPVVTMSLGIVIARPAAAQDIGANAPSAAAVAAVTVTANTPLPGTGIDADKTPTNTTTLFSADLTRSGPASVTGALSDQLGGVNIDDNLDDGFQPNILLRGFEASPVLGTPQGVAVFQNGVRINEAFGETVNWDVIPDLAVRRIEVMGANPVFGLNALGGAIIVAMKTGFTDRGGEAEMSGGSFGRRDGEVEFGANNGVLGVYVAARALNDDGWREFSSSSIRQAYGDITAHGDKLALDLSLTAADNALLGEGVAPVQELAVNRALAFTSPQQNLDRLAFVTLNADYAATNTLSLQGAAYVRRFRQQVANGNTTHDIACTSPHDSGLLCQSDGLTPLMDTAGRQIPDISAGGAIPIGENDRERIDSEGEGGSLQATTTAPLFGRDNYFSAGVGLDHASTDFISSVEVGVIDAALQVRPSGETVATPEGTPFNATPVRLLATTAYYGLYATDTFNLTPALAVTVSGRYNVAQIDLADRLGRNLTGNNRYRRFNPAVGFADELSSVMTLYADYSEGSRAPNPSEIECSNPLLPCLLPSALASDPPTLKQVVSHTWEAGLRGRQSIAGAALTWKAGLFRTDVDNDIYGVATSLGAGYFQNIGGTRREGVELGARYQAPRLTAYASYSYIDATFRSALTLPSSSNPFRNRAGNIEVRPGDHLPGIPRHRLKAGADWELRHGWTVGASAALVGDAFYVNDEGNQLAPLPGYAVVSLHSTLDVSRAVSLFVTIDNALNARYATFGVLGDPTGIGAPGVPANGVTNGPGVDNRFQSPASPIAVYAGVKLRLH